jgi:hypothetical protein
MNIAIAIPAFMALKSLIFGSITLLLPIRFDLSIGGYVSGVKSKPVVYLLG